GVRPSRDRTRSASVHPAGGLEHRIARVGLEARGGEERRADAAGEERVAAGHPRGLGECVSRKPAGPIEPQLVLRPLECGEQREAVARGAVTDPVTLLGTGRTRAPDELRAREEELLVEVAARGGDDSGRARAPLKLALAAPVGQAILARRGTRE